VQYRCHPAETQTLHGVQIGRCWIRCFVAFVIQRSILEENMTSCDNTLICGPGLERKGSAAPIPFVSIDLVQVLISLRYDTRRCLISNLIACLTILITDLSQDPNDAQQKQLCLDSRW
jgi:hypothetical protein